MQAGSPTRGFQTSLPLPGPVIAMNKDPSTLRSFSHGRWLFWLPALLRIPLQRVLEGHPLPVGQLQALFRDNSFWGRERRPAGLLRSLRGSDVIVSTWDGEDLVAVGRATSDGIYRAVLWDVVVRQDWQGRGAGRAVVSRLLAAPPVRCAERVYAMTTHGVGFYRRLGFHGEEKQHLMLFRTGF